MVAKSNDGTNWIMEEASNGLPIEFALGGAFPTRWNLSCCHSAAKLRTSSFFSSSAFRGAMPKSRVISTNLRGLVLHWRTLGKTWCMPWWIVICSPLPRSFACQTQANPSNAAPIFAKTLVEGDSAVGISVKFVKECLHSIFVHCLSLGTHLYLYTCFARWQHVRRRRLTPNGHVVQKTHRFLLSKSCLDCNVVSIQLVTVSCNSQDHRAAPGTSFEAFWMELPQPDRAAKICVSIYILRYLCMYVRTYVGI